MGQRYIPHAAAEGFRQAPRPYGEQPKDYGTIDGFKSEAIIAGKNFVDGFSDGVTGIFKQPYQGAKEDGAVGALKGFAKGTLGVATKVPSGTLKALSWNDSQSLANINRYLLAGVGLIAYPFHGISKSFEKAYSTKTRKEIMIARLRDGDAQATKIRIPKSQKLAVIQDFERFVLSAADV